MAWIKGLAVHRQRVQSGLGRKLVVAVGMRSRFGYSIRTSAHLHFPLAALYCELGGQTWPRVTDKTASNRISLPVRSMATSGGFARIGGLSTTKRLASSSLQTLRLRLCYLYMYIVSSH